jgi:hypothetical protein
MLTERQPLVRDAMRRRIEEQHRLLLDASWAFTLRHLQDFQILLIEQPGRAAWLFRQTVLARETVTTSRAVVIADDHELAEELRYWEDRAHRLLAALGASLPSRARPAKVVPSSPRLTLVPKPAAR